MDSSAANGVNCEALDLEARTYGVDQLALHQQTHRCMHSLGVSLEGKLEIVLGLFPLWLVSDCGHNTKRRTDSSRSLRPFVVLISEAMVLGPYWRVSCRPSVPAVCWMDAVLPALEGTILYDASCAG